ncbi:MAG: UDP-N-acetylmuramoyl-tripeptide--D-alanyl-D-alanine ligase [Acidobacteria bacterium]|nr:UDP-N-acetylmuramoyl-tripeptide--D-alanyl-D-alanine ligase [Acidobacteriota bacterium]
MRMTAAEVSRATGGRLAGSPGVVITGATVDSRRLRPGDLFVALPGERRDGHEFVAGALSVAAAALVRLGVELPPPPADRALIAVDDPLAAFHRLATAERERRSWRIAGITGSVGKTTTKEFLAHLLAARWVCGASAGNRNSTLGLPAELLSQPENVEVFVAEMGMSRAGELDVLGRIVRPDVVLYTRLAPTHTEFLKDMDAIIEAKAELLQHLRPGGVLVLNADDPAQERFSSAAAGRVVRYGRPDAAVRAERLEDLGLGGTRFDLVIGEARHPVTLQPPGAHQVENLVAAAAAAWVLGVDPGAIATEAGELRAAPRRGRLLHIGDGIELVDDSYNASPLAVGRMLELLRRAPGRRVAVLGEMYELGERATGAHAEAGRQAAASCDLLIAVGHRDARTLAASAREAGLDPAAVYHADDAEAAATLLKRVLRTGDVVLVKGSRGVGLDRAVDALVGEEAA